jgi:hypothetical protein
MNPEIKTRWVAALRSGDYEQGIGSLSPNGHYCCLGVLCELAVEDGKVEKKQRDGGIVHYDECEGILPKSVVKWAGLDEQEPDVLIDGEYTSLINMNDGGDTFATIADAIESGL